MNERREVYESYWAFEAGKWTKIDSVNRQVFPKIYDAFSKKKLDLTEIASVKKSSRFEPCSYMSLSFITVVVVLWLLLLL